MDHWRGFYRMASHGTHANPKGVTWNIQNLSTVDVVWAGPSNAGLVDPAQCTLIALTSLTAGLLAYAVGELPDSADYWIPNLSIAHVRHQTIIRLRDHAIKTLAEVHAQPDTERGRALAVAYPLRRAHRG